MTNSSANTMNLRNAVLNLLIDTEKGEKSHVLLKNFLDNHQALEKQERAFLTRLYQGTIERKIELDYIINQFSNTKTTKMKPVILHILRLSVYQLKYMNSVPAFAVCNEAVKLANKRKLGNLKGFVNGVLRSIAGNLEGIKYPTEEKAYLSVKYSVPLWLIELWNKDYGIEKTKEILENLYEDYVTTVRCNQSKREISAIIESLEKEGVSVERTLHEGTLRISGYDTLEKLTAFRNGDVTVQNLSSVLAGVAANPKDNDYIIDVCAAPGGKTLCMADLMNQTGTVDARDLTKQKISLIEENVRRIGFQNIKTRVQDAMVLDEKSIEKADVVMADLPCSGLGVIGNKSDIKYNVTLDQIEELAKLQRQILTVVSQYVKPGGTLIFSTCTVNKQENNENAKWILENLPLKEKKLTELLPKELHVDGNQLQIFPGEYGMDGFFIAAFTKQS